MTNGAEQSLIPIKAMMRIVGCWMAKGFSLGIFIAKHPSPSNKQMMKNLTPLTILSPWLLFAIYKIYIKANMWKIMHLDSFSHPLVCIFRANIFYFCAKYWHRRNYGYKRDHYQKRQTFPFINEETDEWGLNLTLSLLSPVYKVGILRISDGIYLECHGNIWHVVLLTEIYNTLPWWKARGQNY